jgi:hypothetical protein
VEISGADFIGVTKVKVGDAVFTCPGDGCDIQSPEKIVLPRTSAHPPGPAQVSVTNAGGTSEALAPRSAVQFTFDGCGQTATAGQTTLPSGYSLIGMPTGTAVPSQSYLYGWVNLGSGGSYQAYDPVTTSAVGGQGYWAWLSCSRPVGPLGFGSQSETLPLAANHASMIGNPSGGGPVTVAGQDFAARWNPALNDGMGGYLFAGYRASDRLAVGEGAWVFSYADTTIQIGPQP